MKVKIPNLRHGPEYDAFADCIKYAVEHTKISDERGLSFLAHFMERMADNVCAGRVVPIPAIGKFGAWLEERPARRARYNHGHPYCVPQFVAARPFREQVKTTAPCNSSAKDALRSLRRNASRSKATMARVHSEYARIHRAIDDAFGKERK